MFFFVAKTFCDEFPYLYFCRSFHQKNIHRYRKLWIKNDEQKKIPLQRREILFHKMRFYTFVEKYISNDILKMLVSCMRLLPCQHIYTSAYKLTRLSMDLQRLKCVIARTKVVSGNMFQKWRQKPGKKFKSAKTRPKFVWHWHRKYSS